ncbi:thrombopoietin receptor [Morone saxatilis]|uniref:thrombopoietin receptor n=1 Tax=Morone saxatilis TaxID=34816 RepID=UPI0015E254A2|nr:thrombopoietin receptor [Morone saxatilis]
MNSLCRWEILLISVWIVPGIHCKNGTVNLLSREDIRLLKDVPDPKCFTRTEKDFTCFFETADKMTYDLFYRIRTEERCSMSVQRTEEGTFLHICSFPSSDVLLFVGIHLKVVERNTNTTLYERDVSVEDNFLLDPPFNVSVHHNDQAGQLRVSWTSNKSRYWKNYVSYRIQYSSKGLGEKIKEPKEDYYILDSLVPGEEVKIQLRVKRASNLGAGHWSSWSHPMRAMVPQSADDISLTCYTSDLQTLTCQWNGSRYNEEKLFYKMGLSETLGWTEWTECLPDRDMTDLCRFQGDKSSKVRVKLSSTPLSRTLLSRTFYSPEFMLNNSIKTSPPRHLRGTLKKNKLCLEWKAPLPSLSAHLQYEVGYQIRGEETWMMVSLKNQSGTCLEVPTGRQYNVKCRAKLISSIYWSDWSDVLTGDTPTDSGIWLMLCIPVLMLIMVIILIALFPTCLSELKLYIWPPVPNLDKVLQGFLTELNGPRWDPPSTAKQCFEETTSSVLEIISPHDDEVSGLGKPSETSTPLLSPGRSFSSTEQVDGSPGTGHFPDYVTLNRDSVILCPKGNMYVYEQVGEKEDPPVKEELIKKCHSSCTNGSVCTPPCSGTDFLNHSYLLLAKSAEKFDCKVTAAREPGNLYTNFPCS